MAQITSNVPRIASTDTHALRADGRFARADQARRIADVLDTRPALRGAVQVRDALGLGEGVAAAQLRARDAVDADLADAVWLDGVTQYTPDAATGAGLHPLVALADRLGVPMDRAISDIISALGLEEAARASELEGDPLLGEIVDLLLTHGGQLDLDTLSFLIKLGEELAKPIEERGGAGTQTGRARNNDRVLAMLQALTAQLEQAMQQINGRFDRLERLQSSLAGAASAEVAGVRAEMAALAYQGQLSELRMTARDFANNPQANGAHYFTQREVGILVEDMASVHFGNERADTVSAREWQAAVAGISRAPDVSDDERVIMMDQLATHILSEAEAGRLSIDRDAQAAIEAAAEGAPEGTEVPADAAPVETSDVA